MARPRQSARLLLCAAALSLMAGCAALTVREYDAPVTRSLIETIARQNNDLRGFKGIGNLRLRQPEGTISARVAWMGRHPDRLRIELINAGQPMAKLAVDGKWFYLLSHTTDRFYKTRSADPNLKRLVEVPVRASDMIALLSGRIPLAPFHYADIRNEDGRWLVVLKHWGRTVQRLYLDEERKRVRAIERLSTRNHLRYKVVIDDIRTVDGFAIPFSLDVSGDRGAGFSLQVDRYWADAAIDPSRFHLRPVEP